MKVLLVAPPLTFLPFEKPRVVAPLGIAYIAAFLEKNGQEVKILDTVGAGWQNKEPVSMSGREFVRVGLPATKIQEAVASMRPDIVGISCLFSSQAHNAHGVAKLVKSIDGKSFQTIDEMNNTIAEMWKQALEVDVDNKDLREFAFYVDYNQEKRKWNSGTLKLTSTKIKELITDIERTIDFIRRMKTNPEIPSTEK